MSSAQTIGRFTSVWNIKLVLRKHYHVLLHVIVVTQINLLSVHFDVFIRLYECNNMHIFKLTFMQSDAGNNLQCLVIFFTEVA